MLKSALMRNLILLLLITAIIVPMNAQKAELRAKAKTQKGPIGHGRAATGPISSKMVVVSDLDARLAKYKTVRMPFSAKGLTPGERQVIEKLVQASQYLEDIFWRQSDPEALQLYRQLAGSQYPRDEKLRSFLFLNASRFDLLDNNKPFVGSEPMPPGAGLYPQEVTRAQIERYVKDHPEKKAEIYNSYSVVRKFNSDLQGVPYHIAYRDFVQPAARLLREAAALTPDKDFAEFLRMRADALLTDDYYKSDVKWLELKRPKIDIVFAPYETYLDGVLGVKGSYGAAVMIRNEEESKKLELFEKYVPDIQEALPLAAEDRPSKKGHETPMEVVDAPYRTGDFSHGYQSVADNLPNDPRIHQEKGTKKIFFKNFLDARVNYIIVPLAKKMMRADQAALVTAEGYLAHTMMHEIAHGLGPAFARSGGKQLDIREALGPIYSPLEEAKADVLGMFGLMWLMDHGYMAKEKMAEFCSSYTGDLFRTARFGVAEAHGRAEMMEFNYLVEQGVISRDARSGRYIVNEDKMVSAINTLSKELLEMEATGDRARAVTWFEKYDKIPESLQKDLMVANAIPVDITPVFSWTIKVR
jgi:hypothetical protein